MVEGIAALERRQIKDRHPGLLQFGPIGLGRRIDLAEPVDIAADKARYAKGLIVLGYEKRELWAGQTQFLRLPAKDIDVEIRCR